MKFSRWRNIYLFIYSMKERNQIIRMEQWNVGTVPQWCSKMPTTRVTALTSSKATSVIKNNGMEERCLVTEWLNYVEQVQWCVLWYETHVCWCSLRHFTCTTVSHQILHQTCTFANPVGWSVHHFSPESNISVVINCLYSGINGCLTRNLNDFGDHRVQSKISADTDIIHIML